ncbi:MAG: amidase [Parvularculales bacterium]
MSSMTRYADLAALVTTEQQRAVEQINAVCDDLEGLGRSLDAVASVHREDAISQAAAIPAPATALSGVPLAHKELFRRKGWPDEGGSRSRRGMRCKETCTVIENLDAAGAIDCARLVTVEFAFGVTGHNDFAGTPRNPWNQDYICGGSSSGSAAVVAAGIVPVALGSDTGGSIRLPAAACGLFGIKPTHGLVSRSRVFALSASLDTVGPLARSLHDAAAVLEAIISYDPDDPESIDIKMPSLTAGIDDGINGLKVGRMQRYFLDGCDAPVAKQTDAVINDLGRLGGSIVDIDCPGIEAGSPLTSILSATESFHEHENTILNHHRQMNPQTVMRILAGMFSTDDDYRKMLALRASFNHRMISSLFKEIDLLITPVWPCLLPDRKASDAGANPDAASLIQKIGRNTRPFNWLGLPVVTVPVGLDENGLPMAVQLVGPPFSEAMLIRTARVLEQHYAFWDTRPKTGA